MADIIIKKENESFLKIDCDEEMNHRIYKLFSAFMPGYRFNPRYIHKLWDGKHHSFSPITQLLPIGLLSNLTKWCEQNKISYKLEDLDDVHETIDKEWLREFINERIEKFDIRDYQLEAVHSALQNKKGVLLSCTGSGKSLMIFSIIRYLLEIKKLKKIVLIVPNKSLVNQMYNDFIDYGWSGIENYCEKLHSEEKPTYKVPVLISTWQSLQMKHLSFFEDYDCVIVDECQQAKANVLRKLTKAAYNAEYKIGTTGTLPTEIADQLQINEVLGDVIFELKSMTLIKSGYLSEISIACLFLKYPEEIIKQNKDRTFPEEIKMVEEYPNRNSVLNYVIDHSKKTDNMLILVTHKEHLKRVKEHLEQSYPDRYVKVITGDVKAKLREDIRQKIESEDGTLLIATYQTMSAGVNIPKLHDVFLYADSKSRIKVLQSIGRGLRLHKTKNRVIVYDIIDDLSYVKRTGNIKKNYCLDHFDERYSYYKEQRFPTIKKEIKI
jgi:superfamily II DNA or RNA helicase